MIVLIISYAFAALQPEKIFEAPQFKRNIYYQEGMVVGGDGSIKNIIVHGMRYSKNQNYERLVIDLQENIHGDPSPLIQVPYYQLALLPDYHRLTLTLWGNPQLLFAKDKVLASIKTSPTLESIELLPVLDDKTWTFILHTKKAASAEIFSLSARLIIDLKLEK